MKEQKKGLIIIFTGEGKGKTTAALGMALRAIGHHLKVFIIQFIKGKWQSGELKAVKGMSNLSILPMGSGFICKEKSRDREKKMALEAWDLCRKKIESKEYDMVIMDEINYAIHYNLLNLDDVISFLKNKPKKIHIVLTGRNAKPKLIEIADIVTEMRDIKHSYRRGVKAQKGIEY